MTFVIISLPLEIRALGRSVLFLTMLSLEGGHCQIPCGIYDDKRELDKLKEDAKTINKAAGEIRHLAPKSDPESINQRTRWILAKDKHAEAIVDSVSRYFLAQRLKPSMVRYQARLKAHHEAILAAVKAKQSVDQEAMTQLTNSVNTLVRSYKPRGLVKTRRKNRRTK